MCVSTYTHKHIHTYTHTHKIIIKIITSKFQTT